MSSDLNCALAHTALSLSSGYALANCSDLKFARVAFGLYLVDGVLAVVEYVLPRSNRFVQKSHEVIQRVARPLYLPLIAAEAIVFAGGFEEKYAYCHLVCPGIFLLVTELLKKNVSRDIMDLSTIANAVSLCYSSYKKTDLYGGLCALVSLVTFMGTKDGSVEFAVLLTASNLLAVQFFKKLLL